jgi:hypothetical protein
MDLTTMLKKPGFRKGFKLLVSELDAKIPAEYFQLQVDGCVCTSIAMKDLGLVDSAAET